MYIGKPDIESYYYTRLQISMRGLGMHTGIMGQL